MAAVALTLIGPREVLETMSLSKAPRALLDKVTAVIETVRTGFDFPKRSQSLKDKLSSISIVPALSKVKLLFESARVRVSSIRIFSRPAEVSLEQAAIELPLVQRAKNAAQEVFAKIEEKVEALENPLEMASLGLEWAALVETLEHHAEVLADGLGKLTAPLKLVALVSKMKKIHKTFFKPAVEGSQPTKASDVVSMGFSLVSSLCGVFSWLQKIGVLSPAAALAARLSLIGGLCSLVVALVDLGENVKNYTTSVKLVKAFLNFAAAVLTVVLIVYAGAHLQLLLLMLGTGILILNVAAPDKEPEEVSAV
jgi:hypothetical protein